LIRIVVEADTEIVIGDIAVQIDPTVANGAELIKAGVPEVRALGVTSGTIGLHFKLA
jgi:phosphotransacetylase